MVLVQLVDAMIYEVLTQVRIMTNSVGPSNVEHAPASDARHYSHNGILIAASIFLAHVNTACSTFPTHFVGRSGCEPDSGTLRPYTCQGICAHRPPQLAVPRKARRTTAPEGCHGDRRCILLPIGYGTPGEATTKRTHVCFE